MRRVWCRTAAAGAAALLFLATGAYPATTHKHFAVKMRVPRVSAADGQSVVSFQVGGDVRGILSFTLTAKKGGEVAGEWVLVSRYLRDLVEEDPHPHGPGASNDAEEARAPRHEGERELVEIYERGTLRGAVTGGAATFDEEGRIVAFGPLTLTVVHGSIEFEGATGTATASGTDLLGENGSGTLNITLAGGH